jgi:anti-sigma factor (TIGR02949 family)
VTRTADAIDCEAALAQLDDYLKREVTPDLARKLEQHIERCAPCFRHLQFAQQFHQRLRTPAGTLRCPDALKSRIAETLRAESGGH